MKRTSIAGMECDIFGCRKKNSPLILMIPGGSGKNYKDSNGNIFSGYQHLAEEFSLQGFTAVIVDTHGQGRSKKENGYSVPNAVNDVATLINYLKILYSISSERVGIWGRCGGGVVAMRYVLDNPGIISSIALWGVPYQMTNYYSPEQLSKSMKRLEEKGVKVDRESINQIWNFEDMVSNISCPLLFVRGLKDKYFLPDKASEILPTLSRGFLSVYILLSEFGHEVDNKHPYWELYVSIFADWFKCTIKER